MNYLTTKKIVENLQEKLVHFEQLNRNIPVFRTTPTEFFPVTKKNQLPNYLTGYKRNCLPGTTPEFDDRSEISCQYSIIIKPHRRYAILEIMFKDYKE